MRISNDKIVAGLPGMGVELRREASLAELTSLGIGGTTDMLLVIEHHMDLVMGGGTSDIMRLVVARQLGL